MKTDIGCKRDTNETGEATMMNKLKLLTALGLITTAAASFATAEPVSTATSEFSHTGSFIAEDPAIYDLGADLAVVFYYDNEHGERTVVTTVAPKDPDSGRSASEHIVVLGIGERYRGTIARANPAADPIQITVTNDDGMWAAAAP